MTGGPDPLAALRDLHWPAPIDGSLPASLATAALGGAALAVVAKLLIGLVASARCPVRRAALAELARTRALDEPERIVAQAALLRRLARTFAEDGSARERGAAWLERLDRLFATDVFSRGRGQGFGDALYLPDQEKPALEDAELARLIGRLRV